MKHIEDTWPDKFKEEVHDLLLSIAMDGVNSYSLQKITSFVWPFVVINNNIAPWLSMKNEHLMLSLIVLGRRQVKNVDVYLQLLIDEFRQFLDDVGTWNCLLFFPFPCNFFLILMSF